MSHSPSTEQQTQAPYLLGWRALSAHLRRGYSWSGSERDTAFVGLGDGHFHDVSAISGLDILDDGRSAVTLDLDLDGDLDVLRVGRGSPRLRCLENQGAVHGGFVGIRLVGLGSMGDAIGARLTLRTEDGHSQAFVRRAGSGFLAQEGPWSLVAMPRGQGISAEVLWTDGSREVFPDLVRGRRYVLRQGVGRAGRFVPPGLTVLGLESGGEHAPMGARVVASAPLPFPSLLIQDQEGAQRRVLGTRTQRAASNDQPTLLHVFSVDCTHCVANLPGFSAAARGWAAQGVALLALSSDPAGEQLRVRGLLEKAQWPGAWGRAPEPSLRVLEAVGAFMSDDDGPLVLPATFLFDGSGRLVTLYRGALSHSQVQADLALAAPLDAGRRRSFAGLGSGRWVMAPREATGDQFAALLRARGLSNAAKELEALSIEVLTFGQAAALVQIAQARWQQGQKAEALALMREALALGGQPPEKRAEWLRTLASMETVQGHDQLALDLWQESLGLEPDNGGAQVGLGVVLFRLGRRAEYEALLADLTRQAPHLAAQLQGLVGDQGP